MHNANASKFGAPAGPADAAAEAAAPEAVAAPAAVETADDGEVDLTGLSDKDVQLVMEQAKVSMAKAAKALRSNNGDFLQAIMSLSS
jgi:nascent polypeptide-associated complex subunit alpha